MSKVSIITSAYNAEKYIEDCTKSVFGQSHTDLEWILIDDGSSDNTQSMIKDLAAKDSRIKPVFQENAGLAAARNNGLDLVTGEFFCFLDVDDLMHPHMIERVLSHFSEDLDFVGFDFHSMADEMTFDDLDTSLPEHSAFYVEEHPEQHFRGNAPTSRNNWNKIYRTSALGHIRYAAEIQQAQDVVYGWRIRKAVKKFGALKEKLFYYRQSPEGVSRKGVTKKYLTSIYQVANQLKTEFKGHSFEDKIDKDVAALCYKAFVKKSKTITDAAIKDLSDTFLKELLETKVFNTKRLSWRKRLSLWVK